ncbi:hypothetical protein ACFFMN_07420 [Planobispora siamensis]|uniref:Uncharacterized protein n=1 Tax=Planobispora siamensis TaxID=936338 RepID=A0A8J3WJ36_9ACTN|nr:hypothetical protein [Planobispora siamensis]GIH90317.1 hypothetical protein Psi01_09470 [Planobispora siamensis]
MDTAIALLFIGAVLFGADRVMVFLESRGHVYWRHRKRRDPDAEPVAELESMLTSPEREPAGRS